MNQDYNNLDIIDTPRCRLRPLRGSDAPAILKLYSNLNVVRFTEHHFPMQSIEEAYYSINFYRRGYVEMWMYRWGITLYGDDTVIGTAGLHRINRDHHFCSIGYEIDEPYWNQGISTEVVKYLTTYGFTISKLHRIEAELIPQNIASARVLQKNNYRYEATRREYLRKRRLFHDLDVYSILRPEWEQLR
jgi:[ribosomal protein S5]-alanine N-acetyltransferase